MNKSKVNFGLPYIHNYADAVVVSEKDRDKYVNEILEYFEKNPAAPYFFFLTGDSVLVGFNFEEEINITDAKVRKTYTISKNS